MVMGLWVDLAFIFSLGKADEKLFETETKRKIKYDPALSVGMEMGEMGELFPGKDTSEEARAVGDIVTQLWSF